MSSANWAGQFLIDLSDDGGAAPGWDVFTGGVTDAAITDQLGGDNDVTLTITGVPLENNFDPPGTPAVIDGVPAPAEARDDYIWGQGGNTDVLYEIQNLDAGTYKVSVFEGRASDSNGQFGRVWVGTAGDDPGVENTGDFAGTSATLTDLTIGAGDSLFYLHQEDNIGGTSGIVVQTQGSNPAISTLAPAKDEGNVKVNANLVATFDREIMAGAGNITIKNLTDLTEAAIPVGDARVTIEDAVLTINPATDFEEGKSYAVRIAATAITDLDTNPFGGIDDDMTWNFATLPFAAPSIATYLPAVGAMEVLPARTLVATFDEDIAIGTGDITIKNLTDGTQIVIPVGDAQVTIDGAALTIDPENNLLEGKDYAVQIAATAITDLATHPFAGIGNDTTWFFKTALPPDALGLFLIDFSDNGGSAPGWDVFTSAVGPTSITDRLGSDGDVTLTITGSALENNLGAPGTPDVIDGVLAPAEARDDYIWGEGGNSNVLYEIQNLDAGTYKVSVFEGRTTDANGQFGKIWVGTFADEPAEQNTGDFAGTSATLADLTITPGDSLFYLHQEDGFGGTSGLIIKFIADAAPFVITEIVSNPDADPFPTVTLTWRKRGTASYIAKVSTDMTNWNTDLGDSLTANDDENPDDEDHITLTFELAFGGLGLEDDLFFRIETE